DIYFFKRLVAVDDLPGRLALIGERIGAMNLIDGYLFSALDETGNSLKCECLSLPAEFKSVEETYRRLQWPLSDNDESARCLIEGTIYRVDTDNIHQWHQSTQVRFARWKMVSMALIPIRLESTPIGTLMIFSQRGTIAEDTVHAVSALLADTVEIIENARRFSVLAQGKNDYLRIATEREHLIEFFSEANSVTVEDEIYKRLVNRFLGYFDFEFVLLCLVENDQVTARAARSLNSDIQNALDKFYPTMLENPFALSADAGAIPSAIFRKCSYYFADVEKIKHLPMSASDLTYLRLFEEAGLGIKTLLHAPILYGDKALGTISCYSSSRITEVDSGQIRIIELLARFFGAAIQNAKHYTYVEELNKQLTEQSAHDDLTGLYNFGFLQEELARRIAEHERDANRDKHPISVIMLDIDFFKKFNDTYGHLAGNAALVEAARRIMSAARRTDIVCRYGGEEFCVILPNSSLSGATSQAERFRLAISESPFDIEGKSIPVTISLGVTEHIANESMAALIGRADSALYRAKTNGRDRVESAEATAT
ncbi:MAG: GGDEF domain-containing protein, partial [Burkholderiaceae bacterium]